MFSNCLNVFFRMHTNIHLNLTQHPSFVNFGFCGAGLPAVFSFKLIDSVILSNRTEKRKPIAPLHLQRKNILLNLESHDPQWVNPKHDRFLLIFESVFYPVRMVEDFHSDGYAQELGRTHSLSSRLRKPLWDLPQFRPFRLY